MNRGETDTKQARKFPDLLFPFFWGGGGIPCFSPFQGIPCFLVFFERFPLFPGILGVRQEQQILVFGGCPQHFSKQQEKEDQGLKVRNRYQPKSREDKEHGAVDLKEHCWTHGEVLKALKHREHKMSASARYGCWILQNVRRLSDREIPAPPPQKRPSTSRVQNWGWCVFCLSLWFRQFAHHPPQKYHSMRKVFLCLSS